MSAGADRPRAGLLKRALVPTLSPRGLAVRAGLVLLLFAVLHALGFREYATFLSGSVVAGSSLDRPTQAGLGMLYLLSYFAAVLIAPVLAIAGGILALLERATARTVRLPSASERLPTAP